MGRQTCLPWHEPVARPIAHKGPSQLRGHMGVRLVSGQSWLETRLAWESLDSWLPTIAVHHDLRVAVPLHWITERPGAH